LDTIAANVQVDAANALKSSELQDLSTQVVGIHGKISALEELSKSNLHDLSNQVSEIVGKVCDAIDKLSVKEDKVLDAIQAVDRAAAIDAMGSGLKDLQDAMRLDLKAKDRTDEAAISGEVAKIDKSLAEVHGAIRDMDIGFRAAITAISPSLQAKCDAVGAIANVDNKLEKLLSEVHAARLGEVASAVDRLSALIDGRPDRAIAQKADTSAALTPAPASALAPMAVASIDSKLETLLSEVRDARLVEVAGAVDRLSALIGRKAALIDERLERAISHKVDASASGVAPSDLSASAPAVMHSPPAEAVSQPSTSVASPRDIPSEVKKLFKKDFEYMLTAIDATRSDLQRFYEHFADMVKEVHSDFANQNKDINGLRTWVETVANLLKEATEQQKDQKDKHAARKQAEASGRSWPWNRGGGSIAATDASTQIASSVSADTHVDDDFSPPR